MFCILGPEMGLGDPQLAGRSLRSKFSSNKLKCATQAIPQKPDQLGHRTLGSIFSSNYDSVKSSVRRATSVRVTKRERKIIRAQDIFPGDSNRTQPLSNVPVSKSLRGEESTCNAAPGRSTTPMSALSLDKPLPALPDDQNEAQDDVTVQDFEGYLDILAYLQRGLPLSPRPKTEHEPRLERESLSTSPRAIIKPAPKEDEWMSTRPVSQTSSSQTASASSDELRRLRSRTPSGAPTRSTSVSGNTVTPKSSRESEWGMRGGKNAMSGLGLASRIEEVSEPGTASPILTPDRRSTAVPQVCYHCGRDPTGKDVKETGGNPTTVLEIPKLSSASEGESTKASGHDFTAEDAQGHWFAPYSGTSYSQAMEAGDKMPKTPDHEDRLDFSSPPVRPSKPDPYASNYSSPDELPKQRRRAEIEIENGVEAFRNFESTPPSVSTAEPSPLKLGPSHGSHIYSKSPSYYRLGQSETKDEREFVTEIPPDTSFWKNPEGVILVYQGVEVAGKELFYGSDINYLGSFYDDDEGSSGLGSTRESSHDLAGTGSGLAMIPEGGSSDDLWGDEAFDAC